SAGSQPDVRRCGDLDTHRRVPGDRDLTAEVDRSRQLARRRLKRRRPCVAPKRRRHQRGQDAGDRENYDELRQREPARAHPTNPLTHQLKARSPQTSAMAPPAARNGPNGMGSFRPRTPVARNAAPMTPPSTIATNSPNSSAFHPRNAPSIAPSFRSPPPMPPRLTRMIRKNRPPPRKIPITDSTQDMRPVSRRRSSPTRIPGRVAGDHDVEKAPDGESEEGDGDENPGRPRIGDGGRRHQDHQVCKNAGPIPAAVLRSSIPRIPQAVRAALMSPSSR